MLAAAATLGLLLAGCGGSSSGSSGQDVSKVLSATFGGKKQITSGQLNMSLTANLQGVAQLQDPVSVKLNGPFESRGARQVPKLDLALTAGSGSQSFTAGVISTGDKGFVTFQGTNYALPARTFEQFKRELKNAKQTQTDVPSLSALGVNPRNWLKNPTDKGTDTVNGVKTIHIGAGVDVAKMLDDINGLLKRTGQLGLSPAQRAQLPKSIPDSVKKQIQDAVKEATLDVFTGKDDKLLRKLDVKLKFDVPQSLRSQVNGLRSGNLDFSLDVADLNKPQSIKEPGRARPLSELQRLLGAGAAGTLGGTSSGSGSSSGGGSSGSSLGSGGRAGGTSTAKQRRYLKCLQSATTADQIRICSNVLK